MAEKRSAEDLERQALLERLARQDAELEALRARMDALVARPREEETLVPESYKAWAALSAQEKTQLEADKRYGPAQGLACWEVQLVYLERPGKEPWNNEQPKVRLHARSDVEAKALYLQLCGISGYDSQVSELVAAAVAA